MIHIESKTPFPRELLERAARAALEHQSESLDTDLTIVLTDDAKIRELNRDYLGIDAPTDVISFPASETDGSEIDGAEIDPETGARYLGDILISIPYAAKSAKQAGHPLEAEAQLLVVHGVLHLLGHDHAKPKEKAKMWKAQAEILESLGLGDIKIREE
ncbi:MAG: rRNA maturation RNase YbeY [Anaerolineales bacterium]|nr:rRNA maturation RNase YbeY [Anaerolineales bacterium]NUQ83918.1 rRNA maturation RNase YbeY [Anaerolineales bacterium]